MFRIDLIDKDKNTVQIFPETIDKICRLCLKENGTTNIFSKTFAKTGKKYIDLISMLSSAQIQENDGLPSKICNTCSIKLNDFYLYKQQIETSQILLCIALGKVIIKSEKQVKSPSEYSVQIKNENLNKQNEIITIDDDDDDDEDNQTNFGSSNEKENVQEINLNKNLNKIDRETNNIQTFSKSSAVESILYDILSNKEIQNNNEDDNDFGLESTYSTTECWKNDLSCISCNSNLNTHPGRKFYRFPLDRERCNTWKTVLKLDKIEHISPATCHKYFRLCNRHFTPSMFLNGKFRNKLRKTAIPTDFTEEERNKLKDTVQNQNVSPLAEDTPNDLLYNETLDLSDEVIPIAIADHNYSKTITNTKNKVRKVKEEKSSNKFQCISFDEKGNKIYTCSFCLESFENRHLYKKHKSKEYGKRRRNKPKFKIACSMCGKLITKDRIKAHMDTHSKEKPYHCDICGKHYRSKHNLNGHILIHKGNKQKVCELCGKSYYYLSQLEVHLQTHNTKPNFMCHICGYICWASQSLKRHENNHRLGKENIRKLRFPLSRRRSKILTSKKNECDICHKKFPRSSQVINHMRTHTGERPFKCEYCGKTFQLRGHLDYHILLHTGVKAYECNYCGKKFALNGNLQQHIRTHTGDKPHQCDLCEKRFYTNSSLKKHKKIHQNNLGFKPIS